MMCVNTPTKETIMKLKKLFFAGLLIAAFSATANAQNYQTALGIRLGLENGISRKHFLSSSNAVEGILSISAYHFQLTGLYEYQRPLPGAPGLDWFIGLGAHIGSIYHKNYTNRMLVGADFIIGLEYAFPTVPFTLGLDWKPAVNFVGNWNEYWYAPFAFTARYTLK